MGQLLINYTGTKNDALNHVNDYCNASSLLWKEHIKNMIGAAVNAIEGNRIHIHVSAGSSSGLNMSIVPVV